MRCINLRLTYLLTYLCSGLAMMDLAVFLKSVLKIKKIKGYFFALKCGSVPKFN